MSASAGHDRSPWLQLVKGTCSSKGVVAVKHESIIAAFTKMGYKITTGDLPGSRRFLAQTDKNDHLVRWRQEEHYETTGLVIKVKSLRCSRVIWDGCKPTPSSNGVGYRTRTIMVAVAHMESFRYTQAMQPGLYLDVDCNCESEGKSLIYTASVQARMRSTVIKWPRLSFSFSDPEEVAFLRAQPDNGILLDFLEEKSTEFANWRTL